MRRCPAALGGLVLASLATVAADGEAASPRRVVSLNLCADELVLRLAAPGTVQSVTWLARDPSISTVAQQARAVAVNRGLAEEIVPLQPDLVLAGVYTTRTTVALLRRLKVPVLELDVPTTLPAALQQIRKVAAALGRSAEGEALVADMQAALAQIDAEQLEYQRLRSTPQRPLAAVYSPNGFTVGAGSLIHDLLTRAGLRNLAVEHRIDNYGRLPLEMLLLARPDLLIMNAATDRPPALAYEVLRHPALRQEFRPAQIVNVPSAWWTCPGPYLVDALAVLARAARAPNRPATSAGAASTTP